MKKIKEVKVNPKLSIIIPTLNEEESIGLLLNQLLPLKPLIEIIVSDGGSTDKTKSIAEHKGVIFIEGRKGRALQLKNGADQARGSCLLFLHADIKLARGVIEDIQKAMQKEMRLASFRIKFDSQNTFLSLNSFFSRFSHPFFHFGDQGLWISRVVYDQCGGYLEEDVILEDQSIYKRACQYARPKVFSSHLLVSARKYRKHGAFRLQFFYYKIWLLYKLGANLKELRESYEKFLSKN